MNRNKNCAFTLMELMVVITLIVLLIALAVPAFNTISGGKSTAAASNLISAMLSQARRTAISSRNPVGVLFFRDADTTRTTMVMVYFPDEPPAWSPMSQANFESDMASASANHGKDANGVTFQYHVGDRVMRLFNETGPSPTFENKPVVRYYTCIQTHTPAAPSGINPWTSVDDPRYPLPTSNANYWKVDDWGSVAQVADTDWQVLPPGVGAQIINDYHNDQPVIGTNPPIQYDHYLAVGIIAFDRDGHVVSKNYTISMTGQLGASTFGDKLHLSGPLPYASGGTDEPTPYTGYGVALYDYDKLKNQPGYSEGDWQNHSSFDPQLVFPGGVYPSTYAASEAAEDAWLQANAVHLMVNRTSGALIKTE